MSLKVEGHVETRNQKPMLRKKVQDPIGLQLACSKFQFRDRTCKVRNGVTSVVLKSRKPYKIPLHTLLLVSRFTKRRY